MVGRRKRIAYNVDQVRVILPIPNILYKTGLHVSKLRNPVTLFVTLNYCNQLHTLQENFKMDLRTIYIMTFKNFKFNLNFEKFIILLLHNINYHVKKILIIYKLFIFEL